jgi:hypothetical protein
MNLTYVRFTPSRGTTWRTASGLRRRVGKSGTAAERPVVIAPMRSPSAAARPHSRMQEGGRDQRQRPRLVQAGRQHGVGEPQRRQLRIGLLRHHEACSLGRRESRRLLRPHFGGSHPPRQARRNANAAHGECRRSAFRGDNRVRRVRKVSFGSQKITASTRIMKSRRRIGRADRRGRDRNRFLVSVAVP